VVLDGRMPGRFPAEIFWTGLLLGLVWFLRRELQLRSAATHVGLHAEEIAPSRALAARR
jgi:hypothetical protein